jgi:hypothetical protein
MSYTRFTGTNAPSVAAGAALSATGPQAPTSQAPTTQAPAPLPSVETAAAHPPAPRDQKKLAIGEYEKYIPAGEGILLRIDAISDHTMRHGNKQVWRGIATTIADGGIPHSFTCNPAVGELLHRDLHRRPLAHAGEAIPGDVPPVDYKENFYRATMGDHGFLKSAVKTVLPSNVTLPAIFPSRQEITATNLSEAIDKLHYMARTFGGCATVAILPQADVDKTGLHVRVLTFAESGEKYKTYRLGCTFAFRPPAVKLTSELTAFVNCSVMDGGAGATTGDRVDADGGADSDINMAVPSSFVLLHYNARYAKYEILDAASDWIFSHNPAHGPPVMVFTKSRVIGQVLSCTLDGAGGNSGSVGQQQRPQYRVEVEHLLFHKKFTFMTPGRHALGTFVSSIEPAVDLDNTFTGPDGTNDFFDDGDDDDVYEPPARRGPLPEARGVLWPMTPGTWEAFEYTFTSGDNTPFGEAGTRDVKYIMRTLKRYADLGVEGAARPTDPGIASVFQRLSETESNRKRHEESHDRLTQRAAQYLLQSNQAQQKKPADPRFKALHKKIMQRSSVEAAQSVAFGTFVYATDSHDVDEVPLPESCKAGEVRHIVLPLTHTLATFVCLVDGRWTRASEPMQFRSEAGFGLLERLVYVNDSIMWPDVPNTLEGEASQDYFEVQSPAR